MSTDMEFVMKAWTNKLASCAPPLWLFAAVAAVAAAVLLSVFVDTLRAHLRQGDDMRQALVAEASRAAFGKVVTTHATTARVEQLRLR